MSITPEILLLNEKQAAEFLSVKVKTLQNWRGVGQGPHFTKLGTGPRAAVRYKQSELIRFINAGEVASTAAHNVRCG